MPRWVRIIAAPMESRLSWFMFLLASLLAPLTAQDDPKFSLVAKFAPAAAKPGDSVKLVLTATTARTRG